jgi:hypothetical protein
MIKNLATAGNPEMSGRKLILAEHSIAILSSPWNLDDGRTLPAGAAGAIVGVWGGGKAYEVEFAEPFHAVVTVPASELSASGAR